MNKGILFLIIGVLLNSEIIHAKKQNHRKKKQKTQQVHDLGYKSQFGQDKFLNENIFKNKRNGVFIDIGAHDGITYSNSYVFEKQLDWTGICF